MNEKTFLIASPLPGRQPIARFSVASRPKLSPPEAVNQEEIPEEDRQFHLPASARDEPAGNAHARSRGPAAARQPAVMCGSRPYAASGAAMRVQQLRTSLLAGFIMLPERGEVVPHPAPARPGRSRVSAAG